MPPDQTSFTFKVDEAQVKALRSLLKEQNFEFREVPYAHFGASRNHLTINVYTSGKLLIQGRGAKEFIEFYIEPFVLGEARLGYEEVHQPEMFEPHIGIDESGKGDFFGPLVIAAVYTDRDTTRALMELGAKDSKRIHSDRMALGLADGIKRVVGGNWSVVAIMPPRYNEMYNSFRNLNRLLAWGHATVLENVLHRVPSCPRALSDKFGGEHLIQRALKEKGRAIELQQRTKAESDMAVAAASILARAEFINRLQRLGEGIGETLFKGASAQVVAQATKIKESKGEEVLAALCKKHFKTFAEICGQSPTLL